MSFVIITAHLGFTTNKTILNILKDYPQGLTVKELTEKLNRPISLIQKCLKLYNDSEKIMDKKIEMINYYYLKSHNNYITTDDKSQLLTVN